MMPQRPFRHALAALFASSALLAPASAWAASTCGQSSDCPKGFSCQTSKVYPPCPAIACATGSDCTQPDCEPETISQCTPVSCKSADDCAAGMVCYSQTTQDCPDQTEPACPPDAVCPTPTPSASCTMTTTSSCVPKYFLPCTSAPDCGDGFACVHDEEGSCAGSAGSAPSEDGGSPEMAPATPPVCTTTTLSTSHCEAKTVICASNGDCPSGWTCEAQLQAISNIACAGPVSLDGGTTTPTDCPTPTPQPVQKQCMPPYADLASTGTFGSVTSGSGSASSGTGTPTAAPESPTSDKSATGPDAASDGGCTVGSGHTGNSAFSLLGLVGLAGLAFRRRRAG